MCTPALVLLITKRSGVANWILCCDAVLRPGHNRDQKAVTLYWGRRGSTRHLGYPMGCGMGCGMGQTKMMGKTVNIARKCLQVHTTCLISLIRKKGTDVLNPDISSEFLIGCWWRGPVFGLHHIHMIKTAAISFTFSSRQHAMLSWIAGPICGRISLVWGCD